MVLDTQTNFLLEIVDRLYKRKSFVTVASLAKCINLERKAISIYCANLENQYDVIVLEKGKGYKFDGDFADYQNIRTAIIINCHTVVIFKSIFFKKNTSILKLSTENFISVASTRRNIHEANKYLRKFNIQIKSKKGNLYFYGEEVDIRYCAYILFWKYLKGAEWPFEPIDKNKVVQTLEELLENSDSVIDEVTTKQWSYIFSINLIRFSQGYTVPEDMFSDVHRAIYRIVKPYIRMDNYMLPYQELVFLSVLVQTSPILYLNKTVGPKIFDLHTTKQTPYLTAMNTFIDSVSFPISQGKQMKFKVMVLATLVRSHLFKYTGFSLNGYQSKDHFSERFNGLLATVEHIVSSNESVFLEFDSQLLKIGFYEAFLFITSPERFEKRILVELQTDLSTGEEELLRRTLEKIFSIRANVAVVNQKDISEEDPAFTISTLPESVSQPMKDRLLIHPKLEERDVQQLLDYFDHYLEGTPSLITASILG